MHDVFINRDCANDTVGSEFENIKNEASLLMVKFEELMVKSPSTGRYVALAKTSLEESVMWATKAIALGDLNK